MYSSMLVLVVVAFCALSSLPTFTGAAYSCSNVQIGKRVDEGVSGIDCGASCKGGQCVALVKCLCSSSSNKYMPETRCWRPGTRLLLNGACNSAVPVNTAVATFNTSNRYGYDNSNNTRKAYGHAAIFMGCADGKRMQVLEQFCNQAIREKTIDLAKDINRLYAVIETDSARTCRDRSSSGSCAVKNAGPKCS